MQLALYCPVYGYYEKEEDTIGRGGDYYTSVSVGRLFGQLLAFQFAEWLEEDPNRDRSVTSTVHSPEAAVLRREGVQVVEAGAHTGELARDILGWLRERRAELFQRLEYCMVEPSARRRELQRQALGELGNRVRWVECLTELGKAGHPSLVTGQSRGVRRIIFANELLDALPVHKLRWEAKEGVWFEWGVTLRDGRFGWTRLSREAAGETSHTRLASLDPQLSALLPDGFTVEVCPAAVEWWRAAARELERGKLVTIDYGLTAEEFLAPERKDGTLRGYRHHRLTTDVLALPGEQDITASVNFTALQAAGESAGLRTEAFVTQSQFLTRIAARIWDPTAAFGDWTPERTRQFQTLTHPDHLGRSFHVLVQSRFGSCSQGPPKSPRDVP